MSMVVSQINAFIERPNAFVFRFEKIDNHFIHTYCEGVLLEKFGLMPSQIAGKTLYEFLPTNIAQKKEEFYQQAWAGQDANYEGYLNGIYYLAVLTPIVEKGNIVEVVATAFDITKEKQNELLIQKAEKLAIVGQLAAGVAHEIRNPLTSLKGFTQILMEKITERDTKDYLNIMVSELNRIQKVVNEFMLLSNPTESFVITKTNIQSVIMNVIKFLRPEADSYDIEIEVDFQNFVMAECDINQLTQVLFNVLQNAIEASTYKKNRIMISLLELDSQNYEICIKDYGKGISQERQKYLFEPFYTTKEKGTGMGLMVSKQIIDLHQGQIQIKSQENFGTIVSIILPKKQKPSS